MPARRDEIDERALSALDVENRGQALSRLLLDVDERQDGLAAGALEEARHNLELDDPPALDLALGLRGDQDLALLLAALQALGQCPPLPQLLLRDEAALVAGILRR